MQEYKNHTQIMFVIILSRVETEEVNEKTNIVRLLESKIFLEF
jgi:hypothetical protein